jgi:hypothetical protein
MDEWTRRIVFREGMYCTFFYYFFTSHRIAHHHAHLPNGWPTINGNRGIKRLCVCVGARKILEGVCFKLLFKFSLFLISIVVGGNKKNPSGRIRQMNELLSFYSA